MQVNNKIKISIIIPIFNQEKYIAECMESIFRQEYDNLQIILIDDGSTDNSLALIQEYDDERIKVIHQENSGVSVARNNGILNAIGEWIAFVDPDDVIEKNYISTLVSAIDDEVDIICCTYKTLHNSEKVKESFFENDFVLYSLEEKEKLFLQLLDGTYGHDKRSHTAIGVPWGKLYRRQFVEQNELFFNPRLKRVQDNVFNMQAFYLARKIIYMNQPNYCYRLNNITNYYNAKYDSYAYKNYCELCNERYKFFELKELLKNAEIEKFFLMSVIHEASGVITRQIFNPSNTNSLEQKKDDLNELLNNKYMKLAMEKLQNNRTLGKIELIQVNVLRTKSYILIKFVWGIRCILLKLRKFEN